MDMQLVTLSASGGGLGGKTGLYWIQGKDRKLHIDECKRIMGFPSQFQLNEISIQTYKQLGNSVIVPLIQQILVKIFEHNQQTMNNKFNWKIGYSTEKLIQKLLLNKTLASKILYLWPFSNVQSIILQGPKNTKADLLVSFTNHKIIGISVKARQINFNQICRIKLSRFGKCLKLSKKSVQIFQRGIDNYRVDNRKFFIEPEYQKYIKLELESRLECLL